MTFVNICIKVRNDIQIIYYLLVKLMIINILNLLEHKVYFVSNLTNLNSELCQFKESDISR
jgi:hypothetical protein